ncbi:MAG: response regulator [Planctomycetaceae bacterium]|nr:response regulator [Planctomycetaceae bacterium]
MNQAEGPHSLSSHVLSSAHGEMGERILAFDWACTPLGPIKQWPHSLQIAVRIMLDSRYAMWLGWGPQSTFFYNDAYARMTLGPKHPWALGRPASEVWSEIWSEIGPRAEAVVRTGVATWDEGLRLFLERRGFPEETYHTFSYSPLPDDQGGIGGMLCVVTEDTERTLGGRRLQTLRELAARTTDKQHSVNEACAAAIESLAENAADLPFVLIYLLDGRRAELIGATGLTRDSDAAPAVVSLVDEATSRAPWPFAAVEQSGHSALIDLAAVREQPLVVGPWPEPLQQAVVLPLKKSGQEQLAGFMVAGVSPRLVLTDDYRGFYELLAGQIATAIANARAFEQERRRLAALAELDRAKTTFFSNVSHEFRTPLTLMLGPVEDLLDHRQSDLSPLAAEQLEVVHRNGLRLLRLVNTLLDFSRIEAGRVRATFQPTDLATLTAELASVFRAAMERAGLLLTVECEPLPEPVFVDRDMWEKVVLNLLSNAFKFTFHGAIDVRLRAVERHVELVVRDTGTGIPADDLPRLFERFHRVQNAQGRTHEGSGIGLALVHEVIKLHGGAIQVESQLGHGTTFTIRLPLGSQHLPDEQVGEGSPSSSVVHGATPFVEEALRWLPDDSSPMLDAVSPLASATILVEPASNGTPADHRACVFVVDDNADMRQYIVRLLGDYHVEAYSDGAAALTAASDHPPDLVLTDVMMPRLDGFGLLRELRANVSTCHVPVIMLSARAGEESRVDGLEAGADDYLVKPFSARELLARVTAHLQMARMRREANETLRQSEERLRMALTAARMVAWQLDPASGKVVVSDNAAEVLGLPEGHRLETADEAFRLLHPDDVERHRGEVQRAAEECSNYLIQSRIIRPDNGQTIWVEDRGQTIFAGEEPSLQLIGVVMDITERRLIEEELRASEEQFRLMADAAPVLIWLCGCDKHCTWFNKSWLAFVGRTMEEECGRGWLGKIHPDDLERCVNIFNESFDKLEPYSLEYRVRRYDGQYRWLLENGHPYFGALGSFKGYIGSCIDIHERKQAEQALVEADRKKDEFLATLAHELRNPLAPLRNGLEVIKLAKTSDPAIEQSRTMMERQLGQMVRLIDDLLDVSRISQGKLALRKERAELARIIEHAVETSRPLIKQARHELTLQMPEEPIYVDADITRMAQVFANLLNNAARYTEQGGHIALSVERHPHEVVVQVQDDGIGISAEMLPHVFELFAQGDRSLEQAQGGLGIGLTLVKRLVEMHGGTVVAHSAGVRQGSRFAVHLPLAASPVEAENVELPVSTAGNSRRRILVADDNRDGATTLALMLRILGHETVTAHDGVEAVETAEQFQPDLVILDIGMPRMNGYEAAAEMRKRAWGARTILVALTGWGRDDDRRKTKEAGFDLHLVKPIEPATLERLLVEWPPRDGS